jgi:2-dehydropantoate 2-reductase
LILGAGGLGGYYGGMLLKGGADVAFLVRPGRAARLAARGLIVKNPEGDFVAPVRTLLAGEVDGSYDIVLLACKTYDLESAIEAIAPAVGPQSAVLPVLNGIGHITILTDRFGDHRVLGVCPSFVPNCRPRATSSVPKVPALARPHTAS